MAKRQTYVNGSEFFARQLSMLWVGMAALVLLALLAFSWHRSLDDPRHVFWGMIAQDLATPGMTMNITQSSKNAGTQEQIQFGFSATRQAHTVTKLTENGATVTTQTIELPTRSYTQYVAVTPAAGAGKKPRAFAGILGLWADTSADETSHDKNMPAIFGQVLLSLSTPFGNLPGGLRATLMQEIQQNAVYTTAFSQVKRQTFSGRPRYIYTVQIAPAAYVRMMQDYGDDMGMHELDQLDPGDYASQTPSTVQWTVDVWSRQLVSVVYQASGRHETYTSYGVPLVQHAPTHPVSAATLQARAAQVL